MYKECYVNTVMDDVGKLYFAYIWKHATDSNRVMLLYKNGLVVSIKNSLVNIVVYPDLISEALLGELNGILEKESAEESVARDFFNA